MNCLNHPETPAVAFCRSCGKPLCDACRRPSQGTVYCEEHVPAAGAAGPAPYVATPAAHPPVADASVSPGLAFMLGLIPGVGAIYNGQYAKGLVHAIVFGLLVSIVSSDSAGGLEPLFGILIAVWVFYMAIEAYHTARKRRSGVLVDEFSSLVNLHSGQSRFPAGALVLITVGVLLLLNTLNLIPLERILRYWPVLLILFGFYLLYVRLTANAGPAESHPEVGHDQH